MATGAVVDNAAKPIGVWPATTEAIVGPLPL